MREFWLRQLIKRDTMVRKKLFFVLQYYPFYWGRPQIVNLADLGWKKKKTTFFDNLEFIPNTYKYYTCWITKVFIIKDLVYFIPPTEYFTYLSALSEGSYKEIFSYAAGNYLGSLTILLTKTWCVFTFWLCDLVSKSKSFKPVSISECIKNNIKE